MTKLVFKKPVKLNLGAGKNGLMQSMVFPKSPEPQNVSDEVVDHWYIQALMKEGHVVVWKPEETKPVIKVEKAAAEKPAAPASKKEKIAASK